MAALEGATVGRYSHSPKSSRIFPTDTFDFGRSTSDGLRMDADKIMPDGVGMACHGPRIREKISAQPKDQPKGNGLGRFG